MSRCRSCRAPGRWITLPSGKRMLLDPEPVDGGTVVLREEGAGEVLKGEALHMARVCDVALYRPHFATCPDADDWRRP